MLEKEALERFSRSSFIGMAAYFAIKVSNNPKQLFQALAPPGEFYVGASATL